MEASLYKGDYIVSSYIENWDWLRDMNMYVFVVDGDVLVKRIRNDIRVNKTIELISDNKYYPPFSLKAEEIVEVWAVKARVTYNFPAPADPVQDVLRNIALEQSRVITGGALQH